MFSDYLQMLRFVAAGLVPVTHSTFYYSERVSTKFPVWHSGEIGVPIFFMISGLVMVLVTTDKPQGRQAAQEFLLRRLVRIVPLYWLATFLKIGISLVLPSHVLHNHFDIDFALKSLLFIPVYNEAGELRPIHGVGWTLFHEMMFYLMFSVFLLLRWRPAASSILMISTLVALGAVVDSSNPLLTVLLNPINVNFVIGIVAGVILANGFSGIRSSLVSLVLGSLVLLIAAFYTKNIYYLPSFWVVGAAVFIVMTFGKKSPLALRWMLSLGGSSYALYLFHPFLAPGFIKIMVALPINMGAGYIITFTCFLVVISCHVLHLLLEKPLLVFFQKRLFPKAV